MTNKARKRLSVAGTILYILILLAVVFVLAAVGYYILGQVWDYAYVYDETESQPVIDAYMDNLKANLWDDSIGATLAAMPHQVQTDEEVAALVKEMLQNDLGCALDPTKTTTGSETYNLMADGNVFGTVTLVQDTSRNLVADVNLPAPVIGALAKIGVAIQPELYPWKVGEESFDFTGLYSSISITVPAGYRVALNGVNLSDDYIVERDIHFDNLEAYYYRYDNLPTKVTYKFDNIMGHVETTVYDENGQVFVIDPNKGDEQYLQPVDADTMARLQTHTLGFSDAYLKLSASTGDPTGPYNELLQYIQAGGEIDEKVKQIFLIGDWSHNSYYQFKSAEVTAAYFLGQGNYMVEYTASATVNQPAGVMDVTRNLRSIVNESGGRMITATIDDI